MLKATRGSISVLVHPLAAPFCRLVVDLVFGYNEITMALSPAQYGLSSKNKLPRIAGRRFPVR
jgi:hypothetical protein